MWTLVFVFGAAAAHFEYPVRTWGTPASQVTSENGYHQSSTTLRTKTNLNNPREDDEYSPAALQEFLSNYAGTVTSKPLLGEEEDLEDSPQRLGNSYYHRDWELIQKNHKHPYDDKKGWVTLEPIPWSVSKISKWQSHQKPQEDIHRPRPYRPSYYEEPEEEYVDRFGRPSYQKPPTAFYGHKVQVDLQTDRYDDDRFHRRPTYQQHQLIRPNEQEEDCNNNHYSHIITDGRPSDFPQDDHTNRRQSSLRPQTTTHPFSGDGEWILLSTTKGFKYPKSRERSLKADIGPSPTTTTTIHRSVRLTVLPPAEDSKVNMTTSHGGLLQVESGTQTVEQHVKKQKQRPHRRPVRGRKKQQVEAAVTTRNNAPDTSTVLAAVGAGMIPATMAMLVPVAMGGKRRRRRGVTWRTERTQIVGPKM